MSTVIKVFVKLVKMYMGYLMLITSWVSGSAEGLKRNLERKQQAGRRPELERQNRLMKASVPLHHELTMDVLAAGKHVYTEWPLGANLAESTGRREYP